MRYLLDTNIISNIIKFPNGNVAERLTTLNEGELWTSIIVAAELRFGYTKKASTRLKELIEVFLSNAEVPAWESPADEFYASLRTDLERQGKPIGQNDMLIAAHALALDATLVTDNDGEFSRVAGLRVENWLRT